MACFYENMVNSKQAGCLQQRMGRCICTQKDSWMFKGALELQTVTVSCPVILPASSEGVTQGLSLIPCVVRHMSDSTLTMQYNIWSSTGFTQLSLMK